MKADLTRVTFDPTKHYHTVLEQQGRVHLEADWNEQQAIHRHRDVMTARDVIGGCGGAIDGTGFAITVDADTLLIRSADAAQAVSIADAAGDTSASELRLNAAGVVLSGALADPLALGAELQLNVDFGGASKPLTLTFTEPSVALENVAATLQAAIQNEDDRKAFKETTVFVTTIAGDKHLVIRPGDPNLRPTFDPEETATLLQLADTSSNPAISRRHERPPILSSATPRLMVTFGTTTRQVNIPLPPERDISAPVSLREIAPLLQDAILAADAAFAGATVSTELMLLRIGRDRYYVDGILCENERHDTAYSDQPHLPKPVALRDLIDDGGHGLVYLEVWDRHVTTHDDGALREPALDVPDTTTRGQTVWQVKVLPAVFAEGAGLFCDSEWPDWETLTDLSSGEMTANTVPPTAGEEPCELPPRSGYTGLENHLYRVEVHQGKELSAADPELTVVWSRENGSVLTSITAIDVTEQIVTVGSLGPDETSLLRPGDVVEAIDDPIELAAEWNEPTGLLLEIQEVQDRSRVKLKAEQHAPDDFNRLTEIEIGPNLPDHHAKLRRWDGALSATVNQWKALEPAPNGQDEDFGDRTIQVRFAPGRYRTGDSWVIPARAGRANLNGGSPGTIIWPGIDDAAPQPLPHRGSDRHFCRLAIVKRTGEDLALISTAADCRKQFPHLTDLLTLVYGGGDGQVATTDNLVLPQLLRVGVFNGNIPVVGARVLFSTSQGGTLSATDTHTGAGAGGMVTAQWTLAPSPPEQSVEAKLVDEDGTPIHAPIVFGARILPTPPGAEEPGITITSVKFSNAPNDILGNDLEVDIGAFAMGIAIECNGEVPMEAVASGNLPSRRRKPVCLVSIDVPWPVTGGDIEEWGSPPDIVGYQTLVLDATVESLGTRITWFPNQAAGEWLYNLFEILNRFGNRSFTNILAHVTLKGNFIWDANDPEVHGDAESFGFPRDDTTTQLQIEMGRPSGDRRAGGDFEMWTWLTKPDIGFTVLPPRVFPEQQILAQVRLQSTAEQLGVRDVLFTAIPADLIDFPPIPVSIAPNGTSAEFRITPAAVEVTTEVEVTASVRFNDGSERSLVRTLVLMPSINF